MSVKTMDAESRVLWERWKKAVRDEALEEAARECEAMAEEKASHAFGYPISSPIWQEAQKPLRDLMNLARRIRALKGES